MNGVLEVVKKTDLTSTQKLLLIVLISVPSTTSISFSELAFYSSLTRKTVINNLRSLEKYGYIKVYRRGTYANQYKVLL